MSQKRFCFVDPMQVFFSNTLWLVGSLGNLQSVFMTLKASSFKFFNAFYISFVSVLRTRTVKEIRKSL
jgi:hypothetical protein